MIEVLYLDVKLVYIHRLAMFDVSIANSQRFDYLCGIFYLVDGVWIYLSFQEESTVEKSKCKYL